MEFVILTDQGAAFNEINYTFSSIGSGEGYSSFHDAGLALRLSQLMVGFGIAPKLSIVDAEEYYKFLKDEGV